MHNPVGLRTRNVKLCDAQALRPSRFWAWLSALLLAASVATLSGCGRDPGTRAVTGGLIGAGAGAGITALAGGNAGVGALAGGAVGAVGGAATAR